MLRTVSGIAIILGLFCTACGESGSRETRPIEVLFSVNKPSGAQFEVVALQAMNADHRFEGQVFEAPHLFVMENATQPVQGVFKNRDPELPLTVELSFGLDLVSSQEIPPGICCTIAPGSDCTQATETCDELESFPMTREVVFEVFSRSTTAVGFSATIGDLEATNLTACTVGSTVCLTPATFFLEDAKDVVSGVFSKFSDQDPTTVFQVDLYVNGSQKESGSGTGDVVVSFDL